jgi:di/tricarboxylate transporter
MAWEAWAVLGAIGLGLVSLLRRWASVDSTLIALLAGLMGLSLFSEQKLPTPAEAVAGFGNPGLITVGVLYVVAAGLTQTGATDMLARPMLGRPKGVRTAQARLMLPVAALSAFLNNTPIVAMFMPVVADWARRIGVSPSKLLIPLSYAAILGGTCTLIGTSTNLVVYGLLPEAVQQRVGLFTIGLIGLPASLAGLAYVLLFGPRFLPQRVPPGRELSQGRRYSLEMLVEPGGAIAGRSIERAGLRHLPGVYLAEVERAGQRHTAVPPEFVLHGGDRLIFVGQVDSVIDLQKTRGLLPAPDQVFKLSEPRPNRVLVEAVVSAQSSLVGRTLKQARFRSRYQAVVIAVHRQGRHLDQKVGHVVLQPGDVLLIESHPRFVELHGKGGDFYLASTLEGSAPMRHEKAGRALAVLAAMVTAVSLGGVPLLTAAMLAALAMVALRCCAPEEARSAVQWRVLLVIGAAIGIGRSVEASGLAQTAAEGMLWLSAPLGVFGALLGVYLLTMLLTETISNAGAAALAMPIASVAAERVGPDGGPADVLPFALVVMLAASASFMTPFGYQTNLMVSGPGGYRFTDFVRFGLPLNLLVMLIGVGICGLLWG